MAAFGKKRGGEEREKIDRRQILADRLVEMMEKGTAPWQKPWDAGEVMTPVNAVTGKPYRGINSQTLMLSTPDPTDNRWCTYKQAQEKGWQVRKGEKAVAYVEYFGQYEHKRSPEEKQRIEEARQKRLEEGGKDVGEVRDTESRLVVRYTPVFHASQIDGIPPLERPAPQQQIEGEPDPRIEALAKEMGVEVVRGGGQAFYRLNADRVHMPEVGMFHTATGHDTTFLHELSHATGHESRMNREMGNPFGSEKYAKEELRAEMSAAMTAMTLGIGFDPQAQNLEEGREAGNTAAYLASWLKSLPEKDRKNEIMAAIKDAQAISDYLIERTPEVALEKEAPVLQSAEKEKESPTLENVQQQAHTLSPSDYDLGKEHRNTPYLHKDHENHWKISVIADDNKRHWGNAVLREKDGVQKLVSRFDLDENRSMLVNVVARDGRLESRIAIDNKEDQSRTFVEAKAPGIAYTHTRPETYDRTVKALRDELGVDFSRQKEAPEKGKSLNQEKAKSRGKGVGMGIG